ncbi:MAG: ribbon-helix-helix protein, CopG family [Betaproteobacteria bacterium]|nr:ribbon-helix-helix protein, CopG family [Betaproteobacteria bacterium]
MKNITITLDDETASRVRVAAAERNMSVSRFVGDALRDQMREADRYEKAMKAWFASKPFPLKGPPQKYPAREELHDRPMLRRR